VTHPLHGCFTKVDRADSNIEELHGEIRRFLDTDAYALRVDPRKYSEVSQQVSLEEWRRLWANGPVPERLKHRIEGSTVTLTERFVKEFWLRATIRHAPPVEAWGVRIGEIVHDLRSALDHLVWQLTIANGHVPPPFPLGTGDQWRRTGFPITDSSSGFGALDRRGGITSKPRSGGINGLWGVRDRLRTEIQRLQPWCCRKHPERTDLWKLQELWNIDKHRTVVAVGSVGRFIETLPPQGGWVIPDAPEAWLFEVLWRKRLGPFEDNAILATIRSGTVLSTVTALQDYVNMHAIVSFDVAFEPTLPFQVRPVIETLNRLKNTVTAVLVQFESEFR
jgi:hypothetical protein